MTNATSYLVTDSHGNRRAPITRKELAGDYLTSSALAQFDTWAAGDMAEPLDLSDPGLPLVIERDPFQTPTRPNGQFEADVRCDSCGMRDRLLLSKSLHAVDMGDYWVVPVNGPCDCPDCSSTRQGKATTFRRVG